MNEPMLDGELIGPSPDELTAMFYQGIIASLSKVLSHYDEKQRETILGIVMKRWYEAPLDDSGLRAVWLAGRESVHTTSIDIVQNQAPGPDSSWVEVEDEHGRSVNPGEWVDQGDTWAYRIPKVVLS